MERLVHIDVQGCWPDGLKNHHTVIPWSSHIEIHKAYGNTQTAEQVAKRGGFGLKEAVLYYKWEKPIVWFSKEKDTWPKTEEDWIKVEYHFNIKNKKIVGINLHIIKKNNMDDPRGITLGNSKTWRGDTYTAVAEMTAGSCKGCCFDNNETCMAPMSAHLFDKCKTNKVIYKKN